MTRRAMTSGVRTKIIEELKTNRNAAAAARQFGFGETTILTLCKKEGIELKHLLTKAKYAEVVKLLTTNWISNGKAAWHQSQDSSCSREKGGDRYKGDAAGCKGKKDTAVYAMGAWASWRTSASVCRVSERRLQALPVIEHGGYRRRRGRNACASFFGMRFPNNSYQAGSNTPPGAGTAALYRRRLKAF